MHGQHKDGDSKDTGDLAGSLSWSCSAGPYQAAGRAQQGCRKLEGTGAEDRCCAGSWTRVWALLRILEGAEFLGDHSPCGTSPTWLALPTLASTANLVCLSRSLPCLPASPIHAAQWTQLSPLSEPRRVECHSALLPGLPGQWHAAHSLACLFDRHAPC